MRGLALLVVMVAAATVTVEGLRRSGRCPPDPLKKMMMFMMDKVGDKSMDEMMEEHQKKMMENHKIGCLDVTCRPDLAKLGIQCLLVNVATPLANTIIMDKVPSRKQVSEMMLAVERCKIAEGVSMDLKIVSENGALDFDAFNTFIQTDFPFEGNDVPTLKTIIEDCAGMERKIESEKPEPGSTPAEKSSLSMVTCMLKEVMNKCGDQDIGKALPMGLQLSTMAQEGQCQGVQLPNDFVLTMTTCLDEAKETITAEIESTTGGLKALKELLGKRRGGITAAMDGKGKHSGLKDKVKEMVKKVFGDFYKCTLKDTEALNENGEDMSLNEIKKLITGLDGWNDDGKKEEVGQAYVDCFTKSDLPGITDTTVNLATAMDNCKEYHQVFYKCFMTKYASICGMNNKLTEFFMPITNQEISTKILGDVKMAGAKGFMMITGMAMDMMKGSKGTK